MHIMWYESKMLTETLDSIYSATQYSQLPIEFHFCLNSQTYLETPSVGNVTDMFDFFLSHPIMKSAKITYKGMEDEFYNIGDWRREIYSNDYKYTVWGESDCLLPEDFFYILSSIDINTAHILTFASRKMWDSSWDSVEHEYVEQFKRTSENLYTAPVPYNANDIINQQQLNEFNEKFDEVIIKPLDTCKIDGSLLCLSKDLPTPFVAPEMNFVREDTCAERVFNRFNIPQYVVKNRMKGHNYKHPLKRTNTNATRNDETYKLYESKSVNAMNSFLRGLYK